MGKRILTILVLVAVIAAAYFVSQSGQGARQTIKETPGISDRTVDPKVLKLFQITDVQFYADSYNISHVYGEVKNTSDTDAVYVLVEVRLIDKEGNLAKKIKVKVKNVPSGQVRSFDVSFGTYNAAYKPEAEVMEVAY
jgi:microcompartment protein CcmK/EutM